MLKEWNERGCDRHDLTWRHVHIVDLGAGHERNVGGGTEEAFGFEHLAQVVEAGRLRRTTYEHLGILEGTVGVDRRVGLSNDVVLFFVGRHVDDLVDDDAVDNLAIWALDETKLVHSGERAECTNQTNVWTFWSLDRTHTAVVTEVNVADFEAGTFAAQTTRSEGRQTTTVGEARKRVHLVHELRQLRSSEELLDCGNDWADVDQGLRRDGLDVLSGHALTNNALHTAEADAHLVLDELAHAANAAVGEVVLVVETVAGLLLDEVQHVAERCDHFATAEHILIVGWQVEQIAVEAEQLGQARHFVAQLAVELVTAHAAEVVATVFEERVTEKGT